MTKNTVPSAAFVAGQYHGEILATQTQLQNKVAIKGVYRKRNNGKTEFYERRGEVVEQRK